MKPFETCNYQALPDNPTTLETLKLHPKSYKLNPTLMSSTAVSLISESIPTT